MAETPDIAAAAEVELVREAFAGDREAFSRLTLLYARRIYRTVYLIVRNLEDAKDITQETFLRAYRNLRSFDSRRPFYPWLHRIARNLSLNFIERAEHRNVSLPDDDWSPWDQSAVADPETDALRAEEAAFLRRAMESLSPDHREIITLKHFGECSYAEIAAILDIPIGTVMSRLYNARMKLKSILSRENDR